ncbi:MAG TPA: hypothetical protein VM940_08300 [Chthoniobacterales bacterium]|nr:hypothetical protein [Chthoniobacterales bacterium]
MSDDLGVLLEDSMEIVSADTTGGRAIKPRSATRACVPRSYAPTARAVVSPPLLV